MARTDERVKGGIKKSALSGDVDIRRKLCDGLAKLGLSDDELSVTKLLEYASLLSKWNKVYNLTAVTAAEEVLTHHLLDSASLLPVLRQVMPEAKTILDVGSGGGFPAVPLAVLCPDLDVSAIDAETKKTAFINQAAIRLRLKNLRVFHGRVQDLSGSFDVVVSRAFASLSDFVLWTQHLLPTKGYWLAMKGRIQKEELDGLPAGVLLENIHSVDVPGLNEKRVIVELRRI